MTDHRRHGQGGEEAINHGGDAGENLQDRLGDGADARRGVLGHVDRRHQPYRHRHHHGDEGDEKGAGEERYGAKGTGGVAGEGRLRIPVQAEEEIADRDHREELDRLKEQRQHDPQRGQDRHQGAQHERDAQHPFHPVACPQFAVDLAARIQQAGDAEGGAQSEQAELRQFMKVGIDGGGVADGGIHRAADIDAVGDVEDVGLEQGEGRGVQMQHPCRQLRHHQRHHRLILETDPEGEQQKGR